MKPSIIVFFILFITTSWLFPLAVGAQSSPAIERLEVALWPEYDRHAVLVIYRVQLAADTALPAQIRLPMPADAGEPYATAWLDNEGRLLVADYMSELQGEWNVITLTSQSLVAQLEYYIDYESSGPSRNVVFEWPEGFPVGSFDYELQQPVGAEDLQINPLPDRSITGSDGLEYQQADLGQVLESQSIYIELSYSNPTNQLTADSFVAAPLPLGSPVAAEGGTPDILQILPYLLGGLGLILVAGGGFLYIQSRRGTQKKKRKPKSRTRVQPAKPQEEASVDPSAIYCHQCGTKASVSDRFCRHCGVPLRR
jgi:hypothetical protein